MGGLITGMFFIGLMLLTFSLIIGYALSTIILLKFTQRRLYRIFLAITLMSVISVIIYFSGFFGLVFRNLAYLLIPVSLFILSIIFLVYNRNKRKDFKYQEAIADIIIKWLVFSIIIVIAIIVIAGVLATIISPPD